MYYNNWFSRSETRELKGYPLSQYLLAHKNHLLTYTALEVACHAIEKYCDKLKNGNYEDLIVKWIGKHVHIWISIINWIICFRYTLIEQL